VFRVFASKATHNIEVKKCNFRIFIFTMQINYIYFAYQMQFTAISVSEAPSMKPAAAYTLPIRYLQHRMLLCGHMSIICCQ